MRVFLFFAMALEVFAQTNTSFLDHFTGSTLNARWTAVTSGSTSAVCVNSTKISGSGTCPATTSGESVLVTTNTVNTDGAFIYKSIDKTKSQIWLFAANRTTATIGGVLWLVNRTSAPVPNAVVTFETDARMRVTWNNSVTSLEMKKWDSSHVSNFWDAGTNAWGTSASTAFINTVRPDSYHVFGFEIDGPGARWRGMSFTREGTGFGAKNNGLFMTSLTDWTSWSSQESTSDTLYLVIGYPYTNSLTPTNKIEWIYYADGPMKQYMINGKDQASNYRITQVRGYSGLNGVPDFLIPEDRTTVSIGTTGSGQDSFIVKDASIVLDNGTYYAAYTEAGSNFQIGIASASSMTGTWTKAAANPIVVNSVGTVEEHVYNPALYKDMDEPDASKRWKLIYNGLDPTTTARVYMRTCAGPPTTCTWSAKTQILADGPSAATIANNSCTRSSNVVTCSTSSAHGFIVGVPVYITGTTGCATAVNGTFYTQAGTTGSTLVFNQTAANESGCGGSGGSVTHYDSHGSFRSHVYRIGGIWHMVWNPHNHIETNFPTRISYARGGSLNSLVKSGVLLYDGAIGSPATRCRTTVTADANATRVITVASTAGCAADQFIHIDQDATATNGVLNRILSVDSSTQLTLYTKVDGISAALSPLLEASVTSAYRNEEAHTEQIGPQTWIRWDTCFGVQQASSFVLNSEWMCQQISTTGLLGPYTPIQLNAPVVTHNAFGNDASAENLAPIRLPIPAQPKVMRR